MDTQGLQERWRASWPTALAAWSRFVKLSEPRWCHSDEDRAREGISGSFAMIRLVDHVVVIDLPRVIEEGVAQFAVEILAHEIGHHVYAPGDLVDNARLLARIRHALPTRESHAGLVANLYTDLLINDRLQRSAKLDIAGVYAQLARRSPPNPDRVWALYMRTYEVMWNLPSGSLVPAAHVDPQIAADARLAARLLRVYARDWLRGAGRYATLLLQYLLDREEAGSGLPWLDALSAGAGGVLPDGMAEIEDDEQDGALHPCEDPAITGLDLGEQDETDANPRSPPSPSRRGGRKNRYRTPREYVTLMASAGVEVNAQDVLVRYYRELALPHIIPFPMLQAPQATDPLPEGLEVWDVGSPLGDIDWIETMVRSPVVVPGVTTMERTIGQAAGSDPERTPVDLYLGVDCSGSMTNPAHGRSYPVVAGAVLVLSALRAGSQTMVCLSGEPGTFSETDGFVRSERDAMRVLTGYLGTGYAFGIERLRQTFLGPERNFPRPIHLLVVTDSDIFTMLSEVEDGWEVIRDAAQVAGGGATLVLDRCQGPQWTESLARLADCGWDVRHIDDQESLVTFARAFAKRHYTNEARLP